MVSFGCDIALRMIIYHVRISTVDRPGEMRVLLSGVPLTENLLCAHIESRWVAFLRVLGSHI